MLKGRKFCPKCGTANNATDAYCMKCGYSFRKSGKKSSFKTLFILIVILILGWIAYRIFTGQPIVPANLLNLFKNMTKIK
jgi:predicted nucleic acid-binding Zn ribbon protein